MRILFDWLLPRRAAARICPRPEALYHISLQGRSADMPRLRRQLFTDFHSLGLKIGELTQTASPGNFDDITIIMKVSCAASTEEALRLSLQRLSRHPAAQRLHWSRRSQPTDGNAMRASALLPSG